MGSTLLTARTVPSTLLLALSIVTGAPPAAARQCHDKIIPDAVEPGDRLGGAVTADGDRALVGATERGNNGTGAAYVFERGPAGWAVSAELRASDGSSLDDFGSCVALEGDVAAIGAPGAGGPPNSNAGAAYVFRRVGTDWTEEQRLSAPDAGFGDGLGSSIALEGGILAVGARMEDELGPSSGAVYVFVHDGTGWQHRAKLLASDGASGAGFGCAVALAGGRLLVGARSDDEAGDAAGAVYVFEIVGGAFTETAKLTASDAAIDDFFGYALSVDGERALISAPHLHHDALAFGPGAVYVFERLGGTWTEVDRVQIAGIYDEAFFGQSVALSGDLAAVGASNDFNPSLGFLTGATYFLRRTAAGWVVIDSSFPPEPLGLDLFGNAVALTGGTALVGAGGDDEQGTNTGALYALELACICGTLGESACFGDGSGGACPCANESAAGEAEGCANSGGSGARLGAFGTASVAADDLALCAAGLRPGPFNALFAGDALATQPFGDGLRCAGGNVVLLGTQPALPDGTVEYGPGLGALGGWAPGDLRHFQVQYRDPVAGPCGTGFNLSQAVSILFEP